MHSKLEVRVRVPDGLHVDVGRSVVDAVQHRPRQPLHLRVQAVVSLGRRRQPEHERRAHEANGRAERACADDVCLVHEQEAVPPVLARLGPRQADHRVHHGEANIGVRRRPLVGAQDADFGVGQRLAEAREPLLKKHARVHDDHRWQAEAVHQVEPHERLAAPAVTLQNARVACHLAKLGHDVVYRILLVGPQRADEPPQVRRGRQCSQHLGMPPFETGRAGKRHKPKGTRQPHKPVKLLRTPRAFSFGPRTRQLRTSHLRTRQLRTSQLRTSQLRTSHLRTRQLRTRQLRTRQLRTRHLRTRHLGTSICSGLDYSCWLAQGARGSKRVFKQRVLRVLLGLGRTPLWHDRDTQQLLQGIFLQVPADVVNHQLLVPTWIVVGLL